MILILQGIARVSIIFIAVKVAGYYCSGVGACVIVSDYPWGWAWGTPCVNNRFLVTVNKKTDKFYYVSMDDLKEIEG